MSVYAISIALSLTSVSYLFIAADSIAHIFIVINTFIKDIPQRSCLPAANPVLEHFIWPSRVVWIHAYSVAQAPE